jgi:hypothetical protein
VPANFTIQARDGAGNNKTTGGDLAVLASSQ